MNQKILNLLGLAAKSGNVIAGEEMVLKNHAKAKLCFLATDSGPNTTKKITNKCTYYNIQLVQILTRDEISKAIGKNRVCLIVTDSGFAKKFKEILG